MRQYHQVHYTYEAGTSGGSSWHLTRAEALTRLKEWKARKDIERADGVIEAIDAPDLTDADIVDFLNQHASHPDNG